MDKKNHPFITPNTPMQVKTATVQKAAHAIPENG
jgi:hypothetical protein